MTINKKLWHSRKERKELARQLRSEDPGLEVVHPHAAGIDVGNSAHYVAVRPDRDAEPVRRFECFTADLHRLADWLQSCGVRTVALQSTGVYWIPLYDILEERGLEVYLVNARHTKNLPGRKSDVQESQWLLKLHTYGLLNNSFRPTSEIRVLRTYWRQRAEHLREIGTCILRMQKALGLLFVAGVYPLVTSVRSGWQANQEDALPMMLSLYVTLGVFLLLAARNPSANRSVIAFAAWSSFAHGAVMAVMAIHLPNERGDLLTAAAVLGVIGAMLIVLAPAKQSGVLASASGHA